MDHSGYWELTVAVSPEASEGLGNLTWELGALGVVEEDVAGQGPQLRAFFPRTAAAAVLAASVRAYIEDLRALGVPAAPGEPRVEPLADEDWAEAWRAHFRPTPVGRALLVAPPWDASPAAGRLRVTIEPGRAFGSGQHGSTSGCLERLETVVETSRPDRAIDLGTGSGILAIAAARLGVGNVLAIDDDPDAVAAAAANAGRNGVADRVRCVVGDARVLLTEPVPLLLANLLTAAHLALAPRYAVHVVPGGTLVLGGILDGEAERVTAAMLDHGFRPRQAISREGWRTLELERAGATAAAPSP